MGATGTAVAKCLFLGGDVPVTGGVKDNLAILYVTPPVSLDPQRQCGEGRKKQKGLHAEHLSINELVLRSPAQEGSDVFSYLGGGGRGSVLVVDHAVKDVLGHSNGTPGKIGVVVEALANFNASRGITVAGDKGKHVVGAAVAGFGDERQIWWESTCVGRACRLLVWVWLGKGVGWLSRTHEHLAVVVGTILVFVLGSKHFHFILGEGNIDQVAPVDVFKGMAGSTNLLEHLEATANAGVVKSAKERAVGEIVVGRMKPIGLHIGVGCVLVQVVEANARSDSCGNRSFEQRIGCSRLQS